MPEASKSFSAEVLTNPRVVEKGRFPLSCTGPPSIGLQLIVAYGLIEAALWTPVGWPNAFCIVLAALWIVWAVRRDRFTARDMGIAVPTASASVWVLLGGVVLAVALPLVTLVWRNNSGPTHVMPVNQALLYIVWSFLQQFILQSFFFVRLESLLGGKWAVPVAAALFGTVHLPSALLTVASLIGGLFFCAMFRRYRNIFPLGMAHALLGLMLAACFSDALLHHMRVGLGYVRFHP